MQSSVDFQIPFEDFLRRRGSHYPAGKLCDFSLKTEFMITKIVQLSPMPQEDTYFINDSSKCLGGIHDPNIHQFLLIYLPHPKR